MLPTELLKFRVRAGLLEPHRLKPTPTNLKLAESLITTFEANLGKRRAELDEDLRTMEAGWANFTVK